MSITGYSQLRNGTATTVIAVSDLSGVVYIHWYVDGAYVGGGAAARRTFQIPAGDMVSIVAQDTNDETYDAIANAPEGHPARRSIWFVRASSTDVKSYRIEQQREAEDWLEIGEIAHEDDRWSYFILSPRLDDLTTYGWRVIPIDASGNDGTALDLGTELVVRTPDATDYTVTYDGGTDKMTYTAAA